MIKHRYTSNIGINFIKIFEGFSHTVYFCPAGHMTIGYGHRLSSKEEMKSITMEPITMEQGEALLIKDLFKYEKSVINLINVPLMDYQFDALVSFTYNLGQASLQRSSLRQKVNNYSFDEAASEFLKWVYANGKKLPGLIRRRHLESQLFSNNIRL